MYKIAKELPIGLAMELSANSQAMQSYCALDEQQKSSIVQYIQNNQSGLEAQEKIATVINGLQSNKLDFI